MFDITCNRKSPTILTTVFEEGHDQPVWPGPEEDKVQRS